MWRLIYLIFDEAAEAKKILSDKNVEYFNDKKMIILAKYFEYLGKTKKEIKEELIKYCNSQNRIKYDDGDEKTISNAINDLKKYKIRLPAACVITQTELDEIGTIGNEKTERIFFVMICLAKYMKKTNTAKNRKEYPEYKLIFWESTAELFKLARYSNNFFDRNIIIGDIEDLKYIKTVPNGDRTKNHININTWYEDSEPVIFFDNPEYVYKLYTAYKLGKLSRCSCCRNSIVKTSNRQSMCEKCWREKEREDSKRYSRECMRRKRAVKGLETIIKPL
jgi:hypothetical protein